MADFNKYINIIKDIYHVQDEKIPLHAPVFQGNESKYVQETIDSTFVSSVGKFVDDFERKLEDFCKVKKAVACCNGTSALEIALRLAGVTSESVVITQALSFVATANAVAHIGAECVFIDVDRETLGLSPKALEQFLEENCIVTNEKCYLKATKKEVKACVPMHTFGFPVKIEEIQEVCDKWHLVVVEDAAESLGSEYKGQMCGSFGKLAALSFNGNKIVTTGGGGAVLTNDIELGLEAKKITTTAKIPHPWKFYHDEVAWNFRLPNLNAALGCAQLEQVKHFLEVKRKIAMYYKEMFNTEECLFVNEPQNTKANFWLCAVLLPNLELRDKFLEFTNSHGVMTRPIWEPLNTLPMYQHCLTDSLEVTKEIHSRLVNIPSGVNE